MESQRLSQTRDLGQLLLRGILGEAQEQNGHTEGSVAQVNNNVAGLGAAGQACTPGLGQKDSSGIAWVLL